MSVVNRKNKQENPQTPSSTPVKPAPAASNKWGDLAIRVISAIGLIGGEVAIIGAGHIAIFSELFVLQFIAFHEFIRIGIDRSKEHLISSYIKVMPYVMVFLTSYLVSGPLLFGRFFDSDFFLVKYHNFICYCFGAILIVLFVVNLTPANDSYAFVRLAWSLLGCVVLIIPANLYAYVSHTSLFWFYTCVSLIAWNDTLAYFSGRLFGKNQLIALSPKKTVEGFVGALFGTLMVGWFTPIFFGKFPYTYCTGVGPFDFKATCQVPPEFEVTTYTLGAMKIIAYPAQVHSLIIALFASLIAPFGGFLASGLKRAYGLKDFGNLIPGHGGILDRVDCQFVMASFAVLYISSFVRK